MGEKSSALQKAEFFYNWVFLFDFKKAFLLRFISDSLFLVLRKGEYYEARHNRFPYKRGL